MDLKDRHVVVTGGTGVLGTAIVAQLIEAGAFCHVPNFAQDEIETFPFNEHGQVDIVPDVDLTRQGAVDSYYGALPRIWASIHAAGGFAMAPIADTGHGDFNDQMNMNALSCYLCCRAAVINMRQDASLGGRIVNLAARPALEPRLGGGMVLYAASKAAVAAFTQSLAEEIASEGIWVNAVAPSIIDTPANREAMPKADFDSWPTAVDVASVIVNLASPGNRAARGAVIPVYGKS